MNKTVHIDEIRWADKVSSLPGGSHFIVNIAQNGNGPLRPHHRAQNGNEVLCNPPGRAMGPVPTTSTGYARADAFLWTGPPGNSSGSCNGGTPPGTFWASRAIQLAPARRASSAWACQPTSTDRHARLTRAGPGGSGDRGGLGVPSR